MILPACSQDASVSTFNGSRTGNDSRFIMNYTAFNTTDSQALNVKAGDTIHAEIVMDGGTYTVTVIGEKAKGSVKYIVKTSENENKLIHKKTK